MSRIDPHYKNNQTQLKNPISHHRTAGRYCVYDEQMRDGMKTVTVNTAELEGAALDWAVAKVAKIELSKEWELPTVYVEGTNRGLVTDWRPSTNWSQGGPLIEQFNIWLSPPVDDVCVPYGWDAEIYDGKGVEIVGQSIGCETPLIAAMRAIVASELGDTVEIQEELV